MYSIDSYVFINNNSKNTILFLHGWGCNKDYFLSIANKITFSNSLIIDLPGFGKNKELNIVFSLHDFVDSILLFLKTKRYSPCIIVGHSFGGKLAVFLADKIKIKFLILLSPSIINKRRHINYYFKILLYKAIKKSKILKKISSKMGSEDYKVLPPIMKKTMSNVINTKCIKEYSKLNLPILLIFGKSDKTTPIYLGKKLNKSNKFSSLIILEGEHFFYFQNEATIINIIEVMVENYD